MKIAWFSPLIPEHTEIANHTERLRPALEKYFEPRFISEQPGGFSEPARGAFYPYTLGYSVHDLLPWLNLVDLPIYNLGNNPTFFCKTWFLSQAKPGVVVLHDIRLHHFFEGIYRATFYDKPRYLEIMQEHYGPPGVEAGEAYWRQELTIDFMAQHFPMTAWAIRNALAVVVHTTHARDAVSRLTSQPVWMLPLPFDVRPVPEASPAPMAFTPERPARLVLFGYLNLNRRVIEFLEALSAMDERTLFEVTIIGTVFNLTQVRETIEAMGLDSRVAFYGHVSDEELDAALAAADLAINLRHPTMGEASASQLRIWNSALASLVTQADGYAVMPPETVFFVRPEHERQDIQAHLRQLLRHPAHFRQVGWRGKRHLQANHAPEVYAQKLREHCATLDDVRAERTRRETADRVGRLLPWVRDRSKAITDWKRRQAEEIARLF